MTRPRFCAEYRILRAVICAAALAVNTQGAGARVPREAAPQSSISQLEAKLKSQYAAIEKVIAAPRGAWPYRNGDHQRQLRDWQDDIARNFAAAGTTISEILSLNPPNAEFWRERLETVQLYSQPISPPATRSVFGRGEVQQSAQIQDMPASDSTPEARAAHARGDVRLRMVLAADGKVKYVFPIKSLRYGLTEAAMAAALRIRFEPALRNGTPASEFFTVVYEFKNGVPRPPYVPKTVF